MNKLSVTQALDLATAQVRPPRQRGLIWEVQGPHKVELVTEFNKAMRMRTALIVAVALKALGFDHNPKGGLKYYQELKGTAREIVQDINAELNPTKRKRICGKCTKEFKWIRAQLYCQKCSKGFGVE